MTKNTRSKMFAGLGLMALIATVGALSANAQTPTNTADGEMRRGGDRAGFMEEMKSLIEGGDYDAWVAAHEGRDMPEGFLTEEHFKVMQDVHELRSAGDYDAARALLEENDIQPRNMRHHEGGRGDGPLHEGCPFLK